MRATTHVGTSADGALFGLADFDAGTGLDGVPLGETVSGTPFVYDPFDAYRGGLVSNPNVVVTGSIGSGKSSVVKMMIARARDRGRRVVVVDPKGEYRHLAERLGGSYAQLGVDGWSAPFVLGGRVDDEAALAVWTFASGRPFRPAERVTALDLVRAVGVAAHPVREWRSRGGGDLPEDLRAGLDRLIDGDLSGIVEGPGDPLALQSGLSVLDISSHWGRESLPLTALTAVATARSLAGAGVGLHVVIDEAWALLSDSTSLAWLRGSWKLARARATSHVLVLHRVSDVDAVDGEGSSRRARAEGLVRDCDTVVVMRQRDGESASLVGDHEPRRRIVARLGRGDAMWRSGASWSLVRLRPTSRDRELIDTDELMRSA